MWPPSVPIIGAVTCTPSNSGLPRGAALPAQAPPPPPPPNNNAGARAQAKQAPCLVDSFISSLRVYPHRNAFTTHAFNPHSHLLTGNDPAGGLDICWRPSKKPGHRLVHKGHRTFCHSCCFSLHPVSRPAVAARPHCAWLHQRAAQLRRATQSRPPGCLKAAC